MDSEIQQYAGDILHIRVFSSFARSVTTDWTTLCMTIPLR